MSGLPQQSAAFVTSCLLQLIHMIVLAFLGLLSGILADVILFFSKNSNGVLEGLLLPAIFGFAIVIYFKKSFKKILAFMLISIAAFMSTWIASFVGLFLGTFAFAFLGGAIGAAVLSIGVRGALFPLSSKNMIFLAVMGGVLSSIGWLLGTSLIGVGDMFNEFPQLYFVYPIWQTGIAITIGVLFKNFKDKGGVVIG